MIFMGGVIDIALIRWGGVAAATINAAPSLSPPIKTGTHHHHHSHHKEAVARGGCRLSLSGGMVKRPMVDEMEK